MPPPALPLQSEVDFEISVNALLDKTGDRQRTTFFTALTDDAKILASVSLGNNHVFLHNLKDYRSRMKESSVGDNSVTHAAQHAIEEQTEHHDDAEEGYIKQIILPSIVVTPKIFCKYRYNLISFSSSKHTEQANSNNNNNSEKKKNTKLTLAIVADEDVIYFYRHNNDIDDSSCHSSSGGWFHYVTLELSAQTFSIVRNFNFASCDEVIICTDFGVNVYSLPILHEEQQEEEKRKKIFQQQQQQEEEESASALSSFSRNNNNNNTPNTTASTKALKHSFKHAHPGIGIAVAAPDYEQSGIIACCIGNERNVEEHNVIYFFQPNYLRQMKHISGGSSLIDARLGTDEYMTRQIDVKKHEGGAGSLYSSNRFHIIDLLWLPEEVSVIGGQDVSFDSSNSFTKNIFKDRSSSAPLHNNTGVLGNTLKLNRPRIIISLSTDQSVCFTTATTGQTLLKINNICVPWAPNDRDKSEALCMKLSGDGSFIAVLLNHRSNCSTEVVRIFSTESGRELLATEKPIKHTCTRYNSDSGGVGGKLLLSKFMLGLTSDDTNPICHFSTRFMRLPFVWYSSRKFPFLISEFSKCSSNIRQCLKMWRILEGVVLFLPYYMESGVSSNSSFFGSGSCLVA